jgi:2-polyprenyl-3-methyl-5-hydroxy-6-metoxy-1,4-benzoquinol methylase
LDNSAAAVALARQNGLDAQLTELDQTWPLGNASMDVVLAGEVIEHVMDIDKFVSEAHRVLRPRGLLVVSTPNLAALGRRLLLLLGLNPHIEISLTGAAAGHLRYFTPRNFRSFIEDKGFTLNRLQSDVVNLNASGSLRSVRLARWLPSIGRTLIGSFTKND